MKLTKISPSALDLYETCPYCFYLKQIYVKQPYIAAFEFGTKVHNSIEKYHTQGLMECEEEDVQCMLDEYMEIYTQDYDVCEERFEVPLLDTGIMLTFKMDLIKDGWIMEHKTSSSRYTQEQVDNHKQTTAYAWAFKQYYGKEAQGIRFNVFNKKVKKERLQTLDTFRDDSDFWYWEAWVKEILWKIEKDMFEPKPGRWHIYTICPFNA